MLFKTPSPVCTFACDTSIASPLQSYDLRWHLYFPHSLYYVIPNHTITLLKACLKSMASSHFSIICDHHMQCIHCWVSLSQSIIVVTNSPAEGTVHASNFLLIMDMIFYKPYLIVYFPCKFHISWDLLLWRFTLSIHCSISLV